MQCQKLRTYMETGRVVFVPLRAIKTNPAQPRQVFRQEALDSLAESIRRHGILQPLTVRRLGTSYELVSGERRLRAGQMAGLTEIPCIVVNMDDRESGAAALVENLQRQDLDYIEEARGIANLMSHWGMSQEQAAGLIGKSQSAVANKLRLLRHSEPVLTALREAGLTERHARALLKLPTETEKITVVEKAAKENMSVAALERYIDRLLAEKPEPVKQTNIGALLGGLNRSLEKLRKSGVGAISEQRETAHEIVLTITIPKPQAESQGG